MTSRYAAILDERDTSLADALEAIFDGSGNAVGRLGNTTEFDERPGFFDQHRLRSVMESNSGLCAFAQRATGMGGNRVSVVAAHRTRRAERSECVSTWPPSDQRPNLPMRRTSIRAHVHARAGSTTHAFDLAWRLPRSPFSSFCRKSDHRIGVSASRVIGRDANGHILLFGRP